MAVSENITVVVTVNAIATAVIVVITAMLLIDEFAIVVIAAATKDNDITYIFKIETKLLPVSLFCYQLSLYAVAGWPICVFVIIGFCCMCPCTKKLELGAIFFNF